MSALSSMSSASSNSSSNSMSRYSKNMLFLSKAPKVLKYNSILIVLMIISFLIISIYNLCIFISKHSLISDRLVLYS